MQGRLLPMIGNKIQAFPEKNWKKEFRKLKKLGIKKLEWTIDHKNFNKNPLIDFSQHKNIINLKKKYKININSVTCDCMMQKPFWKTKNNNKLLLDFKEIIVSCSRLKIKYIIIPLVDNGSIKKKKDEEYFVKKITEFNKLIKKHKVKVIFESDYEPFKLRQFIKKFNKNLFGINYDIGNSSYFNYDVDDEFALYGKYIENIHIKDRKFRGKTVRLGEGNANFDKVHKNVKKINYKKNFILQTARSKSGNHVKEIKLNISFLKKRGF